MEKQKYLRVLEIPDERISDHYMLKTKLDIFEGNNEDLIRDRDYWNLKNAHSIKYFILHEYIIKEPKIGEMKGG
jgi:hypothetical protein